MPHNESKKAPRYGSAGRPSIMGANTARIPGANSQVNMSGKLPDGPPASERASRKGKLFSRR